jgi:hypothetical protein
MVSQTTDSQVDVRAYVVLVDSQLVLLGSFVLRHFSI